MGHSESPLVRSLAEVGRGEIAEVGGKGANLGEMVRQGLRVPEGFCLTTAAYRQLLEGCDRGRLDELFTALDRLDVERPEDVRILAAEIRVFLRSAPMPAEVERALVEAWEAHGAAGAWAVRSSATAEDLPDASFAGQQDTYLNVQGRAMLLDRVRRCWASLFADRAIVYRANAGFPQRRVALSVVVQRMVPAEISGIMFTVDPISQARSLMAINAGFGLGEALVSGRVALDLYTVDKSAMRIVSREIADKRLAIRPAAGGGTAEEHVAEERSHEPALNDDQIVRLAELGMRLEEHFGAPQDVEWCIADGELHFVQTRPITTLYPLVEELPDDGTLHVYACFNHIQVMTDPIKPLGRSCIRLVIPFGKHGAVSVDSPYLVAAGGRLYVDPTELLRHRAAGRRLPEGLRAADELMGRALAEVVRRPEFRAQARSGPRASLLFVLREYLLPVALRVFAWLLLRRTTGVLAARTAWIQREVEAERKTLEVLEPAQRLGHVCEVLGGLFPRKLVRPLAPVLAAGFVAQLLVAALCGRALDDPDVVALGRGLPDNVTTDMDLVVGDLADVARQSPGVSARIRERPNASVLPELEEIEGGRLFREQFASFLERYGMRGPSEIDISRPRWSEEPTPLLQSIAGNLSREEPGGHRRHHERLMREAEEAGERLIRAARRGLWGPLRAALVRRLVRVQRELMGGREHPKFLLVAFLDLAKRVILDQAEVLRDRGVIDSVEDVYFLELGELLALAEGRPLSEDVSALVARRAAEHARFEKLYPPRVLTSDGEVIVARHERDDLPAGALAGSGVSAGVVEGRARVVLDPCDSVLEHGEVLVAPFTDPGWTPLFIHAAGLVMEVGGLLTHGSVVAREYGIPAVACVPDATRLIRSGQRIRVDGDRGYVEILTS
ncbi:MAG: phosphoenolpyruvate synthase [Myxococcota bacterium]